MTGSVLFGTLKKSLKKSANLDFSRKQNSSKSVKKNSLEKLCVAHKKMGHHVYRVNKKNVISGIFDDFGNFFQPVMATNVIENFSIFEIF